MARPVQLPENSAGGATRQYRHSRFNQVVALETGGCLIFNSLTNALSTMDEAARERYLAFREDASPARGNDIDDHLIEGGYIVSTAMDEIAHLRRLHRAAKVDKKNWAMTICPTIACNFGCDYCYQMHKPGTMSVDVQAGILQPLRARAPHLESFTVTWLGGEPTIAWDVIQDLSAGIQQPCDQHGIDCRANVVTNGYLLNSTRIDELESLRITHAQVTLDGDAEYHNNRRTLLSGAGTFDRIVENLKHFRDRPTQLQIRVNIDDRNQDGVTALIERLAAAGLAYHKNIGMTFAAVNSTTEPSHGVVPHCKTPREFSRLEADLMRYAIDHGMATAHLPRRNFGGCIAIQPEEHVVQPDGWLHKCWNTVGQNRYAVGHLLDPQHNPLESPQYARWMEFDPFKPALACSSCSWLPACMGGCPYHAVYADHDANSGDGVYLECTPFKFNHELTLRMYASETDPSRHEPSARDICG